MAVQGVLKRFICHYCPSVVDFVLTHLIRPIYFGLSVTILMGFHCTTQINEITTTTIIVTSHYHHCLHHNNFVMVIIRLKHQHLSNTTINYHIIYSFPFLDQSEKERKTVSFLTGCLICEHLRTCSETHTSSWTSHRLMITTERSSYLVCTVLKLYIKH